MFYPWYNLPLINFLNSYIKPNHEVFEYGGGNSTLFYSAHVKQVCTIELSDNWINFILTNQTKDNIELKKCTTVQNFSNEIAHFSRKKFDIIVIDSRDRAKCLMQSIGYLKENGIVILDNSERENLASAIAEFKTKGFHERIFSGMRLDAKIGIASVFFKTQAF